MSISERRRFSGIALMTGSAASNQLGAATAALAFPALGPAGVVAVRQWVAGVVLLVTVRPKFASFTGRHWRPVLALALIFAVMNLSLYTAIDRIGLGLAVTLEFLGPLSVALLASRRVLDLACALVAGGAVVVLAEGAVLPGPTELRAYLGERLAPHKHPRRVVGVDVLPRTSATGQVQRARLVQQLEP